jgi:hypothetical protein
MRIKMGDDNGTIVNTNFIVCAAVDHRELFSVIVIRFTTKDLILKLTYTKHNISKVDQDFLILQGSN